jgi:hypothetical protein
LCKSSNGRTPYELWIGTTLIIHHLRTFGCIAQVKISASNLKRLLDRSKKMIFVGYEPGSATYRCYDPISKGVRASKYVIFDEDAMRDWSGDQTGDLEFDFIMADQIDAAGQDAGVVVVNDGAEECLESPPLGVMTPPTGEGEGGGGQQHL